MYSFLGQDDEEHISLLDMFKSDNFSIPEQVIPKQNAKSKEVKMKAPPAVECSDQKDNEEEKFLSTIETKRQQGKIRAKKSRDRK